METLAVIAGFGVAIALAGFAWQVHSAAVRNAREFERIATLLEDVRGDLAKHDGECRERWTKNWEQHESMSDRISHIEGRLGSGGKRRE